MIFKLCKAQPGWLSGQRVGLMSWWLRVRDPVEKSGRWKESCVSTGVRKPGNTCTSSI